MGWRCGFVPLTAWVQPGRVGLHPGTADEHLWMGFGLILMPQNQTFSAGRTPNVAPNVGVGACKGVSGVCCDSVLWVPRASGKGTKFSLSCAVEHRDGCKWIRTGCCRAVSADHPMAASCCFLVNDDNCVFVCLPCPQRGPSWS